MKGSWEGCVVFIISDIATLHTEDAFAKCDYTDHQEGQTPLICYGVSCISGFALNYMHMACLQLEEFFTFLKNGLRKRKLSSGN